MSLLDDLTSLENLHYAWRKTRNLFRHADGYVDNAELTSFQMNLEAELASIQSDFQRCTYSPNYLRPLPRPKKMSRNAAIDRQYFHISVRDQVAWVALTNILGPRLDPLMPAWSYGNRIYRAAWYDEDEKAQSKKLEIGPYRHASGHLYRKFQHSWPLFRRHVARTARIMAGASLHALHDIEEDGAEERAFEVGQADGLAYFTRGYWQKPKKVKGTDLFHAALDLERFYPSISRKSLVNSIALNLKAESPSAILELIKRMLEFRIDFSAMPAKLLDNVEPPFAKFTGDKGIPTGLFAAGFLANVVLLPIDQKVEKLLERRRDVAHFRYVDDHTILAYDFDDLCSWIELYRHLIGDAELGLSINEEKYDPESLARYLALKSKNAAGHTLTSGQNIGDARETAINDTILDGTNPTRLLTKTLGQVSAIVAGNVDIMDDDDLKERLKMLEWLLLADIPEREIRPDTRAAFAAGQIAMLVPLLVQESDGLIDNVRELAHLRRELKDCLRSRAPASDSNAVRARIKTLESNLRQKDSVHRKKEFEQYRHCFGLQLQAFKEFPGKPRLFYRLCQYCLLTGHHGTKDIANWIASQRKKGNLAWADYYAGLSLQIFSETLLRAMKTASSGEALHSERRAASSHISDLSGINAKIFDVPGVRESWFYKVARNEFVISLRAASEIGIDQNNRNLVAKLLSCAEKFGWRKELNDVASGEKWREFTSYAIGVWAERTEHWLSHDEAPSAAWLEFFMPKLCLEEQFDSLALRRYPERLPENWWNHLRIVEQHQPLDDSGWWRDSLAANVPRLPEALKSPHDPIKLAAKSLSTSLFSSTEPQSSGKYVNAFEWVTKVREFCSPFDPRISEWTALEIVRVIVGDVKNIARGPSVLDFIHPANVLVSLKWQDSLESIFSWEEWRRFAQEYPSKLDTLGSAIKDYRFGLEVKRPGYDNWNRQLIGIGRLLLGLLKFHFDGPRGWNFRGNERASPLARSSNYEFLAISSLTLLILEGCLSARSAENRELRSQFGLFGQDGPLSTTDMKFDAPPLNDPDEVIASIVKAQGILQDNQLAVSRNQPRQLIPFRLADFAVGASVLEEGEGNAE